MNEMKTICDFTVVETRSCGFYVYDDNQPDQEAIVIKSIEGLPDALRDEGYALPTIEMVQISMLATGEEFRSQIHDGASVVRTDCGLVIFFDGDRIAVTAEEAVRIIVDNAPAPRRRMPEWYREANKRIQTRIQDEPTVGDVVRVKGSDALVKVTAINGDWLQVIHIKDAEVWNIQQNSVARLD